MNLVLLGILLILANTAKSEGYNYAQMTVRSSVLDSSDLKPVQYPLLEKSKVNSKVQNLLIDFTKSLVRGCSRYHRFDYEDANFLNQIKNSKSSDSVKSACLFPHLVIELNRFTKEHLLRIKKYNIPQNSIHLTLAARVYDGVFLDYLNDMDPDLVDKNKFLNLHDISTHSAILFRMMRQTLEDAILISNPWFAKKSEKKVQDLRKIAAWISEITPWGYIYRLGFDSECKGALFSKRCESDKRVLQASLVFALEELRKNPYKYEYIIKLREHLEYLGSMPRNNIRRGLQTLRALSGDQTPYMMSSPQITKRSSLEEIFQYLESSEKDLNQYITPNMDRISEDYGCRTILRAFISLQKESDFALKTEMKHLNPFSHISDNYDLLADESEKGRMSTKDVFQKVNCEKLQELYSSQILEEGFLTRFQAYQGRVMLGSTSSPFGGVMASEEVKELIIYTQFEDVLSMLEKIIPMELNIKQNKLSRSERKQAEKVGRALFNYTDGLFN